MYENDYNIIGLKLIICVCQIIILCNQYEIVSTKALYGESVKPASSKDFPYVVAIANINKKKKVTENVFCTGSLVSKRDVLSAAHCVTGKRPNETAVIVGSTNLKKGKSYDVDGWVTYEYWARQQGVQLVFQSNDIVILRLKKKVSSSISLAVLADQECTSCFGLTATTAGWGTMDGLVHPENLQKVDVYIISNAHCDYRISQVTGKRAGIDINTFCSRQDSLALITSGDSGGPVIYGNKIIAINRSTSPYPELSVHPDKVNMHTCLEYYKSYILDVIENAS